MHAPISRAYPFDVRSGLGLKITRTGGTFTIALDPNFLAGIPALSPIFVNGKQGPNITLTPADIGAASATQVATALKEKANLTGAQFTGPISAPSGNFAVDLTVSGRPIKKYGPKELVLTQDMIDSGNANAAIGNLFEGGLAGKRVIIPEDVSGHDGLVFAGGKNVEIFFDGPDLALRSPVPNSGILEDNYTWKNGIFLNNMEDTTLTGTATFGHDNLPFTQGTIIADNGDGSVNVRIDDFYRTDFRYIDGFFGLDSNGLLDSGGNGQPQTLTRVNANTLRVPKMPSVFGAPYALNKRVVLEHKKYAASQILGYSNTDTRWLGDFNITSSSSTGATFNFSAGEQDVSGLRIKRLPYRLLTVNADGIQFNSNRGGSVIMQKGLLEGMADDCMHIFTGQYIIDSVDRGINRIYFKPNGFPPPDYMNSDNPEIRFFGFDGTPRDGFAYIISSGSSGAFWWVNVVSIPPGVNAPDVMVNNSLLPSQVSIGSKTEMGRNWGHGLRLSGNNIEIKNCLFDKPLFSGVVGAPAPAFGQGSIIGGLDVNNNEFRNCQRSTAPQSNDYFPVALALYNLQRDTTLSSSIGHQAISFTNNWFRGCSGGGIFANGCSKASITGNRFVDNHSVPGNQTDGFNTRRFDISLNNTFQVIINGNCNLNNNGTVATIAGSQSVIYGSNPGMTLMST